MRQAAAARPGGLLALVALLAGCAVPGTVAPTRAPDDRTASGVAGLSPAPVGPDRKSVAPPPRAAMALRSDRNPADAPFGPDTLERNFLTIAMAVESTPTQTAQDKPLSRWEGPIRYKIYGGGATPEDRRRIARFMTRLGALSGIDIRAADDRINLPIFILDRAEQRARVRATATIDRASVRFVNRFLARDIPNSPCRGSLSTDRSGAIVFAVVLIHAETSGRLREACVEEELAQSMGLTNDDPEVRPSIFNDDQEFALLTDHDAALLRMLYDPALRPGMDRAEVARRLPGVVDRLPPGSWRAR